MESNPLLKCFNRTCHCVTAIDICLIPTVHRRGRYRAEVGWASGCVVDHGVSALTTTRKYCFVPYSHSPAGVQDL